MHNPGPFCSMTPSPSRCGFTSLAKRALRGKRVAVWGNSITAQVFFAMCCDLMRHGLVEQSASKPILNSMGSGRTATVHVPSLSLNISMLDDPVMESTFCIAEKKQQVARALKLSRLRTLDQSHLLACPSESARLILRRPR